MNLINKKNARFNVSSVLFGTLASFAFILFLIRSDIAIDYMKKGLKLCARTVIPSLFPFMVISELLVSSGVGNRLGRLVSKPIRMIFGVSEGCACAFILGAICGFPIGTKTLVSMLDRGELTAREASKALIFCNNPGSAFVISAVGVSLFGSFRLGVMLYTCVIMSAIAVGAMGRFFNNTNAADFALQNSKTRKTATRGISENFTAAVQSSAASMLTVCAYVAFFSSFVGCLGAILEGVGAPQFLTAAFFGFFELSSGVAMSAELSPISSILFCAAILGWSGLSVHFQVMAVSAGRGISYAPYFWAKAAQGGICATFMGIALKLFPFSEDVFAKMQTSVSISETYSNAAFVCCTFLVAGIIGIFTGFICEKSRKKEG